MKLCGIQARTKSTRLPEKIFKDWGGKSILQHIYDTASAGCRTAVLVPYDDQKLIDYCKEKGMLCFHAHERPEDDLVGRYMDAMARWNAQYMVRVTADCPFVSKEILNAAFKLLENGADYVSNTVVRSFMEGLDVQGVSRRGMRWFEKCQKKNREHPFSTFDGNQSVRERFQKDGLGWQMIVNPENEIFLKTSVDTKEDLDRVKKLWQLSQDEKNTSEDREEE